MRSLLKFVGEIIIGYECSNRYSPDATKNLNASFSLTEHFHNLIKQPLCRTMAPYSNDDPATDDNNNDDDPGEQVRVSLTLAKECQDRTLEVPTEPIAVPADIGRKGLSAVINHLLERGVTADDDADNNNMEDESSLPALPFDFILGSNRKLLRMGVEREARRSGLSLEEAIPITYFPAQEAPDMTGESEPLPDWISGMSFVSSGKKSLLCTATYDGSIQVYHPATDDKNIVLEQVATKAGVHGGPIKCLVSASDKDSTVWIASGSMDHSLALHSMNPKTNSLTTFAKCTEGHASAIGSLDIWGSNKLLASGDWDGGVCIWDFAAEPEEAMEEEHTKKKSKTASKSASKKTTSKSLAPKYSIQAHSSKVSGISFGNFEKQQSDSTSQRHLITGSWDHSLKVWDIERQDCLLTLNGSRDRKSVV